MAMPATTNKNESESESRGVVVCVGGDGFCGWPLSLRLSRLGYEVVIVDNLSRRKIDVELGYSSFTKIASMRQRLAAWKQVSGKQLSWENIDVAKEYERVRDMLGKYYAQSMPHLLTVIHLGEQRAAPYSMKSSATSRYTVDNNLNATHNLLAAMVEVGSASGNTLSNMHFIHLGTMGVYGYGSIPDSLIPEGYIDVKMADKHGHDRVVNILHPAYGGSIYHMTKTQDALFFQFYNKNWKLRITDLHQGIIWGLQTAETALDARLVNRFDFDGDYGTVLNRFLMQTACDIPLTVYGSGGQTRAFIHIENSMDCIVLAMQNPPAPHDRVKIYNQMTETLTVIELAKLIQREFSSASHKVSVQFLDNPRKELSANDLTVSNQQFLALGLKPIHLSSTTLHKIVAYLKLQHRAKDTTKLDMQHILPSSKW